MLRRFWRWLTNIVYYILVRFVYLALGVIASTIISIFFIALYDRDLPEIIWQYIDKYYIKGIVDSDFDPKTINKLSTQRVFGVGFYDYGRFEIFRREYGTDKLIPPYPPSFFPPNFRTGFFQDGAIAVVLWTKDCNADGCRYDVFKRQINSTCPTVDATSKKKLSDQQFASILSCRAEKYNTIQSSNYIGSLRAMYYFTATNYDRNGLPVFVDGNRQVYWWDGLAFRRNSTTAPKNDPSSCAGWFDLSRDEQLDTLYGRALRGGIGRHSSGYYFLSMREPICIRNRSERAIQQNGNVVHLVASDKLLEQAMSFLGEVNVSCRFLGIPGTVHWPLDYVCNVDTIDGYVWGGEKAIIKEDVVEER